ncbi:hypothetical protein DASB73_004790, partial [Starmerella bacillaris]
LRAGSPNKSGSLGSPVVATRSSGPRNGLCSGVSASESLRTGSPNKSGSLGCPVVAARSSGPRNG